MLRKVEKGNAVDGGRQRSALCSEVWLCLRFRIRDRLAAAHDEKGQAANGSAVTIRFGTENAIRNLPFPTVIRRTKRHKGSRFLLRGHRSDRVPPTAGNGSVNCAARSDLWRRATSSRSGKNEVFHGVSKALFLIGRGYPMGRSLHLGGGVPHGDAQPRVGEHQDVVRHVTDRGDLRSR